MEVPKSTTEVMSWIAMTLASGIMTMLINKSADMLKIPWKRIARSIDRTMEKNRRIIIAFFGYILPVASIAWGLISKNIPFNKEYVLTTCLACIIIFWNLTFMFIVKIAVGLKDVSEIMKNRLSGESE